MQEFKVYTERAYNKALRMMDKLYKSNELEDIINYEKLQKEVDNYEKRSSEVGKDLGLIDIDWNNEKNDVDIYFFFNSSNGHFSESLPEELKKELNKWIKQTYIKNR